MTLEASNTIDIIAKSKSGKLELIIADAGITTDPQDRIQKLLAKLSSYVGYVTSKEFEKEHPNVKPRDVIIKVVCKNKPTEQMERINKVRPHGDEDKENEVSVEYEIFK